MKSYRELFWTIAIVMAINMVATAETLHVDSRIGSDENPGTKEKPLRTVAQAASVVNSATGPGPTTIKLAPGLYNLADAVVFKNARPYTEKDRLILQALILPDDPDWKPALMPVLLSTHDPGKPGKHTETGSLKVKINHVTMRGLKFLGNPLVKNWHACIERVGEGLDDLLVTQCMFVGDRDALNIYCPAIATGDRLVVDHCIFYKCNASAVFWDGLDGIGGKRCAMRYCIVYGCHIAGPWTCQTAEDFEFHHNIVTGCDYFWMRKPGDQQKYRVRDCTVTDNKYYCGQGGPGGPFRQTGPEVAFEETNVVKQGQVQLEKNKKTRNYLHAVPDTLGSNLAAGLFHKAITSETLSGMNCQAEGRTPKMAVRFSMIGLFVNDLSQMVEFYRDVIGLEIKQTDEDYALFEHEGIDFALFVRSKLPEWLGQQPSYPNGLNGTFAFSRNLPRFQDVDAEFDRLVKAGAKPVRQPWDAPWGQRTATIADPDGNLIEIGSFNKG